MWIEIKDRVAKRASEASEVSVGELEKMVPLATKVFRQIMEDMDTKPEVRANVAARVLESEGKLKTQRVGTSGKTFVLNLKTEDVRGALEGMRTVFGGKEGVVGKPRKRAKQKLRRVEALPESQSDTLRRAIEAERGGSSEPEDFESVQVDVSP